MKTLLLVAVIVLLTACAPEIDRCTAAPDLPDCKTARASSDATIAAIDIERANTNREATRQAKAAEVGAMAQATQAAAGARATQIAVSVQATKNALEIQAMTQTLMMSVTLSAITANKAEMQASLELSTTKLIGETEIAKRQAEKDTAPIWPLIGVGLVASVALSVAFSFRRGANAVAHLAEVRSALITHGQHAWLITPGQNGAKRVTDLTNLIGDYASTDGLDSVMDQLDVPDRDKLQAWVDLRRQRAAVDISANIHAYPEVEEARPATLIPAAAQAIGPRYQIVAPTEHPQLLAGIPQALDVLDAEWHRVEMSA